MIYINDNLRIVKNDEKNLSIEELRVVTSEKKGAHSKWCWCGYYSNLRSAMLGVLDKGLIDIGSSEDILLKNIIKKIDNIEHEITDAIEKLGKIDEIKAYGE